MADSNLNENEKEEKLNKTETIKKPLLYNSFHFSYFLYAF